MPVTERFSEYAAYLGGINPASYTSEQNSGYVSFANYARGVIICHAGVLGQNVDFDIEQGKVSGGSPKPFNAASKDFTWTATTDNNVKSVIEINAEEFDVTGGFFTLNVEATPAGASSIFCVEIWGLEPRFQPVPVTTLHEVVD